MGVDIAARVLLAATPAGNVGSGVPNPPAAPPPGLSDTANTVIGWIKWGGLVAGVIGLMICGIMMAVGRRQRHALSADGAAGIPWVIAGLSLIAIAPLIVSAFL
jgi:hypothetical protein